MGQDNYDTNTLVQRAVSLSIYDEVHEYAIIIATVVKPQNNYIYHYKNMFDKTIGL